MSHSKACVPFLASLLVCCWIYHQLKCSQTWKTYICLIGHEVVPCCSPLTHWDAPRSDCGCGWHAVPGWLGPAQPSQTQSLLLGFADRWLSGRRLGRFGIHGGPLQLSWRVTRSFTSGWFFRGVLWVSMHDMTTVPFVPVWPVASNLLNVLYNLAKGPIVKCIGVVFLQEFAIVQLIFFDMPLIYDKSGLSHSRLHCDLTGIMVRRGNYPHVRPYFQWGIVIIPVRRGNYHELSQSSLIPNYPNTLFQVGELSLYFAKTHAIFSHHQEDFSARKCARMLGLRPRWKYAVRHRCTCFLTGWWFGTMEPYDFPYIGNVIIPTDELIFFKWVGIPPTS